MQLNSYGTIFFLIPLTIILYYLANRIKPIFGKLVLIASSLVFYSFGRVDMLIYLGISMAVNYFSALLMHKKGSDVKWLLWFPIGVNVLLLLVFKYLNFGISTVNTVFGTGFGPRNIVLPLGISFYTFQQIAYIVSVKNGDLKDTDPIDYLTYILFFPKILMGPIVDPVDFIAQINDETRKKINIDKIASGIKIFSFGLLKKMLIADTFSKAVTRGYENLEVATAADCLLLILFYTFEIYFDFSGYSDMAVGAASLLNIDLPINFDSPYKALSIRDFWKRWHISLTKFLTKYIYIPLGGSRKGKMFTYINMLIVFTVSGLWHGANWTFVVWGVLHGLLSCFDRLFEKTEEKIFKPVRWFLTFVTVSILWLLFSASSVVQWFDILKKAFGFGDLTVSKWLMNSFNIAESEFIYDVLHVKTLLSGLRGVNMIIFIVVSFIICLIPDNNYKKKEKLGWISLIGAAISFVWGVLCLGSESTFVYLGF